MEIEVRKYEKYARDIKRLLIISGVWPNEHSIVQTIVGYIAGITTFLTALAMLNFSIHYISNVMIVTKSFGLVASFLSCTLKVWIFFTRQKDIIYLNNFLSTKFTSDLQNVEDRSLALTHRNVIAKLCYVITYTVILVASLSYVINVLLIKNGKIVLIFPSIFPFNFEPGGLIYWIIEVIEWTGNFFVLTLTGGVDSLFGYYTMQLCGEFRILSNRFENLCTSLNYKKDLQECIQRHHLLMRSHAALERLYGVLSIYLAITSTIILCTCVFQITTAVKTAMSPFRFVFLCFYIVLKLLQSFAYALYGQLITEESALCLDAIYKARWPGCGNKEFMNDVIIILLQKPLVFKAKGCMYLKMELFSKIVNTSVSYFFLLQTLDENA